ncbi:MAG: alpha-L-arabinofuranosidase C-terminal domain-containing protein [Planctomycetota bacterium]
MPGNTSIQVDAARRLGEISPFLFGHFVEHIRDHMTAMWAEVLSNGTFAVESPQTPGLPQPWVPVDAPMSAFVCGIIPPGERGLPRGVKSAAPGGDQHVGLAQMELVVRHGVPLRVSLALRPEGGVKAVRLKIVCPAAGTLAETDIKDLGAEWKVYHTELIPARDSQHAEFQILFRGPGGLSVGAASIMPGNSLRGIRAEVFHMARALRPRIIRYPGGCFADTYHWRDGIGPKTARPTVVNKHWGGLESNDFGADEFLQFCEALRCEPLLCVNLGSGTPEEAAQWVEYCNGSAGAGLGALRARHGHDAPYNVKYWEIGNETYGQWETGHCDARAYAEKYLAFRRAMKAVDPTIQCLAVGHTDMDWNRAVLSAAAGEIEYLTMHFYQGAPLDADPQARARAMFAAPIKYDEIIVQTERLFDEVCKSHRPRLAITEWNAMYVNAAERPMDPLEHSLEAALFNAGLLNVFIRRCSTVGIATFSDLVNGWSGGCIRVGDFIADAKERRVEGWSGVRKDIVYGTPSYYVLQAYSIYAGRYALGVHVDTDAYDSPECGNKLPAFKQAPVVDAVATLSHDGNELAIFVVNRDPVKDMPTRFALAGFKPSQYAGIFVVTGDSPGDRNTPRFPDAVEPIEALLSDVGAQFEHDLPACSLTAILLRKAE